MKTFTFLLLGLLFSVNGRETSQYCLCGHVNYLDQCQQSEICMWNGQSCIIKSGVTYIQQVALDNKACYKYAQEDCRQLDYCGFYLGECVPFIDCGVFQKSQCLESSYKCTTDGSKCIEIRECSDYQTEIGCQYKNIHGNYCYWDSYETPKCQIAQTCEQLPSYLQSDSECRAGLQYCTVSDIGYGCQERFVTCTYLHENQCIITYDEKTECFWEQKCNEKNCENKYLSTDDQCKQYLSKCTTNGIHCVIRKQCQDSNIHGCVTDINGNKCVYVNGCQQKSCQTAPQAYINYQQCQMYDQSFDCVSQLDGGCKQRPTYCIGYVYEIDCYSKEEQDCIWYQNACAKRQCFHAPYSYNHDQCKTYGQCMGKVGGGCEQRPNDCNLIINKSYCDLNYNGDHCIWLNNKCESLICSNLKLPEYNNHQKCNDASKYCTFNIETGGCTDYLCQNVVELSACTIDSQGQQCSLSRGCIAKKCKLAPTTYKTNAECETWSPTCTVNIYQFNGFNLNFGCSDKVTQCEVAFQDQCQTTIQGYFCSWDSGKCKILVCSDADKTKYVYDKDKNYCQYFKVKESICIYDNSLSGCMAWPTTCSQFTKDVLCKKTINGIDCYWDNNNCHEKQCSDAKYLTNIDCNNWLSSCMYQGSGCIVKVIQACSSNPYSDMYDTHQECNAWNDKCSVVDNVNTVSGCMTKLSSCSDYKSEIQCKSTLNGKYCYWNYTNGQCIETIGDGDCSKKTTGDLTDQNCRDFLQFCIFNSGVVPDCSQQLQDCSLYQFQQQCVVNGYQSPCQWDYKLGKCLDLPCSTNTISRSESDCFQYKNSYECILQYESDGKPGRGCNSKPASCEYIKNEIICRRTITSNGKKCYYYNYKCLMFENEIADCFKLINSVSNEECLYYHNQCILSYSGRGCYSVSECQYLTDINCNSSPMWFNMQCYYYGNKCQKIQNCSDLQKTNNSCQGKKTVFNELCKYSYTNSQPDCVSESCSSLNNLPGTLPQNYATCQKYSSICTYDQNSKSCIEILSCNDLNAQGQLDYKLCNNSMYKNNKQCGFNFTNNQCEERKCEHLQSTYVDSQTSESCYKWHYDCVLSGSDCIKFTTNCLQIKLAHQCVQYSQCKWQINECVDQVDCQKNTNATINYLCELISPDCKLDFVNGKGCAFASCEKITDETICNESHASDGVKCTWDGTQCTIKACSYYTTQTNCQNKYQPVTTTTKKYCIWCSSCSDSCGSALHPTNHLDCQTQDLNYTISLNSETICVSGQVICNNYTNLSDCGTQSNQCWWDSTHSLCLETSCSYYQTQILCDASTNSKSIPCFWISGQCKEKNCQNLQGSTDCSNLLINCIYSNMQCVEDCSTASSNTHSLCESYYFSKRCTVNAPAIQCEDLPVRCEDASEKQCFKDSNGKPCYYQKAISQCITLTCENLGTENITHEQCYLWSTNCTINATQDGCIPLSNCMSYTIKEQCELDSSLKPCQWIQSSQQCVQKTCLTQELIKYTSGACQQYYKACSVDSSFNRCIISFELCKQYNYYQCISDGQKNIAGTSCFWSDEQSLCVEQTCENGPAYATSDADCSAYMSLCQKGGCKVKSCSDYYYVVDADCAAIFQGSRCATNGYQCVDRGQCEETYLEDGCTIDINLNECLWVSSTAKCIKKTCDTAPKAFITNNECYQYLSICTAKKGGGCIQKTECSKNLIKEACYSDMYNQGCIWDDLLEECFSDVCVGFCGDGIITGQFEVCDDGNYLPYDGCYKCQIQCPQGCLNCQGLVCYECDSTGWILSGSTCETICGDGIIVGKEYCDDGNDIAYDGCSNCEYSCDPYCITCYQGECIQCPNGLYEVESYCINKCGDGILALEYEECEDGNNVSKDGCSSICEIEKNWKCYIVDQISICQYNISPQFKLAELSNSYGEDQEIALTFSEQVRLNSDSISLDQFMQLITINIQTLNESDYNVEIIPKQSISQQLSDVEYLIRVTFTKSTVGPILNVTINCENLVNQYDNQLQIKYQQIQLKDPFVLSQNQKNVAYSAALFNQFVIYSLISIGSLSLLSGNLEILWNLIDVLQQLSYIKYLNIQFPENLSIYFEIFGLVTVQPLVDKVNLNSKLENFFEYQTPYQEPKGKLAEFSINCFFGINFQSFVLLFAFGVIYYVISYSLQLFLTQIKYDNWPLTTDLTLNDRLTKVIRVIYKIQKMCKSYYHYFFYSGIIRIFMSNYYDITFSAFLQLSNFQTESLLTTIYSFAALSSIVVNCLIIMQFYSYCNIFHQLPRSIRVLQEGNQIKFNSWSRQYTTIVLIKKTIFIFNLVTLQNFPAIQTVIQSLISGVFSFYIIASKPFLNKFEYYKQLITELSIAGNTVLFSVLQFLMTNSQGDLVPLLGWVSIFGFTTILLSTLIIDFYQQLGKYVVRYYRDIAKYFQKSELPSVSKETSK